jgi:hypothetical protein
MLQLGKTRTAVACGMALAVVAAPQAMAAGEGTNARLGVRNPSSGNLSVQTQIIASNSNWGTRQSNKGAGGGAIYGCRSAPGAESCVRAVNLMNGLAFSFQSNLGAAVGSFQIGTTSAVNANAVPFTTNAAGKVTNLNADHVDGLSASQIESQAVSSAVSQAGTAARALSSTAAVAANGALVHGRGVTASTNTSAGTYTVTFGASVTSCVYQATINGAGGAFGLVSTTAGSTATTVTVTTFNTAGTLTNMPFYLTVNC